MRPRVRSARKGDLRPQCVSYVKNNTFGLNVKWDVSNNLRAKLDADQSASHLSPSGQHGNIDSGVGYGLSYSAQSGSVYTTNEANGFPSSYTGGIAVPGGHSLPYPTGFGPSNCKANVLGLDPLILARMFCRSSSPARATTSAR